MKKRAFLKWNAAGVTFAVIAVAGVMVTSRQSQAANDNNPTQDEKQKIQIGARIAPVRLDLTGKDPNTVYLGSYLVNAGGGCNDCHTNQVEMKPSIKYGNRPDRDMPHRGNYMTLHKIEGKLDPASCYRCHGRANNERCMTCHR